MPRNGIRKLYSDILRVDGMIGHFITKEQAKASCVSWGFGDNNITEAFKMLAQYRTK